MPAFFFWIFMHILYLCVVKYDFKRLICDEEKHDIY